MIINVLLELRDGLHQSNGSAISCRGECFWCRLFFISHDSWVRQSQNFVFEIGDSFSVISNRSLISYEFYLHETSPTFVTNIDIIDNLVIFLSIFPLLYDETSQLFRNGNDGDYNSPEDAFSFGRLMIYMFSNWSFAWKLTFFPMEQVQRYFSYFY